ncbi:hypothetical protein POTOM_010979 [Populus tomentosa]|uniref:Late embryogenesis abundant protein LEA-2 subgroup domain-containing protein n=1 Tax=Populus tomentosa TaxID=118781 RepID=A0A8X8ABG6_POPTO|nr:hypothetical protein POTOM_010979 [Populus tomentosa]
MRGFKICCGVTTIFIIILAAIFTTLALAVCKPKNPSIIANPVGLENIQFGGSTNVTLNVTLGMVVTIDNPNYGSFKFTNSTAYVDYHGVIVAEVPIQADLIPAHSEINITTSVDPMADDKDIPIIPIQDQPNSLRDGLENIPSIPISIVLYNNDPIDLNIPIISRK